MAERDDGDQALSPSAGAASSLPRDRFRGALLGLAVGDALGAPAEFLTSAQVRDEYASSISAVECAALRCRTIAISGATPDPPPTRSSGPPSRARHTKWPPSGPRTSKRSPTCAIS